MPTVSLPEPLPMLPMYRVWYVMLCIDRRCATDGFIRRKFRSNTPTSATITTDDTSDLLALCEDRIQQYIIKLIRRDKDDKDIYPEHIRDNIVVRASLGSPKTFVQVLYSTSYNIMGTLHITTAFLAVMSCATQAENHNMSMEHEPKYKLIYFQARWRGEGTRLIFAQTGVPYEDFRVSNEEWPQLKPSMPFGQLPVLEVNGQKLGQTFAIDRYLGKKYGLAGNSSWEEAKIDSIVGAFGDFFDGSGRAVFAISQGGPIDKDYNSTIVPARDAFLVPLRRFLDEANSGYVVGNKLSWADLIIADHLASVNHLIPGFLSCYPEITQYVERITNLPKVKAWIQVRPVTDH